MAESLRDRMPGLFPPAQPPVAPPTAPQEVKPGFCACCNHHEKLHCTVGTQHGETRVPMGSLPKRTFRCKTRHCTSPLCCCTEFAKTAADVKSPQVPFYPVPKETRP